jgi:glutamate 5-kinase
VRNESLQRAQRIIVKLGTGVLTDSHKQLDPKQMGQLVRQVAAQRRAGKEIVLVSSGAVGAGMGALDFEKRPKGLHELQACAAIGQSRLMATYEKLFARYKLHTAQILLTHDDLQNHDRHLNARNTLLTLLRHGVVPIVNENDTVSVTELRFGDNDRLSALVAALLPADLLVILTTVEGVIANFGEASARVLPLVERIDENIERLAGGTNSVTAVGGMSSKIQAAKIAMRSGIPLVIASGKRAGILAGILNGQPEGTLFVPSPDGLRGRKRWIAFFHRPKGALFVDDGARLALSERGKSLLLPGVVRCQGAFSSGDVVEIRDLVGREFARGISRFASDKIQARALPRSEVVHRDDLVLL